MMLEIVTGSFITSSVVSQHVASTSKTGIAGLYSSSFCIPFLSGGLVLSGSGWSGKTIFDYAQASGSITFDTYWKSRDGGIGFHTGSLEIKAAPRFSFNTTSQRLQLIVNNARPNYKASEKVKFRVFVNDINIVWNSSKITRQLPSVILEKVHYRIRDIDSGEIIIPFKTDNDATRLSTDSAGLYFNFDMSVLNAGRTYTIDFLINERGIEFIENASNVQFKVGS